MKVWKFLATVCCSVAMLTACSDSDENGPNNPIIDPENPIAVPGMNEAVLTGQVRDADGTPLQYVSVTSGTASATTDANGCFVLTKVNVNDQRTVVKFSSYGYFDVVRAAQFKLSETWDVVMTPKSGANYHNATYLSSQAQTMVANGMKVEMPSRRLYGRRHQEGIYRHGDNRAGVPQPR